MTKKQAQDRANKLVKKLGKGWKPRVWFNLDWCYAANDKSRKINVYPLDDKQNTKYDCLIADTPGCGGLLMWTDDNSLYCSDPVQAVKIALKYARSCVDGLNSSLKEAEDSWEDSQMNKNEDRLKKSLIMQKPENIAKMLYTRKRNKALKKIREIEKIHGIENFHPFSGERD
jgi:hypothetical protein